MSPRAAWRLESLGFHLVCDYVAGKADWGTTSDGKLVGVLEQKTALKALGGEGTG